MFRFVNIDSWLPGQFESMGMLKGKRWYTKLSNDKQQAYPKALFKPRRKEFKNRTIYCANHFGEFVGYLLAENSGTPACTVELSHLSKYYESIHKEIYHATPEQKEGCVSYSQLKENQILQHGNHVIESFCINYPELYQRLMRSNEKTKSNHNNNIAVCLAAIEKAIIDFYRKNGTHTPETIESHVLKNRIQALNMIIYDCLYGNNDRHDENWALVKSTDGKNISLYPLYDNERVLGLYENIDHIREMLNSNIEKESDTLFFSRMTIPGESKDKSTYKDVLEYLVSNYGEARDIIRRHTNANPPKKVREILEKCHNIQSTENNSEQTNDSTSCQSLPKEYVEFGIRMYQLRYQFAIDLLKYKGSKPKETSDLTTR